MLCYEIYEIKGSENNIMYINHFWEKMPFEKREIIFQTQFY